MMTSCNDVVDDVMIQKLITEIISLKFSSLHTQCHSCNILTNFAIRLHVLLWLHVVLYRALHLLLDGLHIVIYMGEEGSHVPRASLCCTCTSVHKKIAHKKSKCHCTCASLQVYSTMVQLVNCPVSTPQKSS